MVTTIIILARHMIPEQHALSVNVFTFFHLPVDESYDTCTSDFSSLRVAHKRLANYQIYTQLLLYTLPSTTAGHNITIGNFKRNVNSLHTRRCRLLIIHT